jgi:hypothetical protein
MFRVNILAQGPSGADLEADRLHFPENTDYNHFMRHFIIIAAFALTGCHAFVDHKDEPPVQAATPGDNAGLGASMGLAKDEEQSLYLKMLSVELNAGVKVPKDQLHSSKGLAECHRDPALPTCQLRVRTAEDQLSATQPLPPEVNAKIWTFIQSARPDLKDPVMLADVICDYVGKQSPPYTVEDVHCSVRLVRATDEAVFGDKLAATLGDALRGSASYGTGLVTLSGSLSCQWLAGTPRTPCVTRAITGGVLGEKLTELDAGDASEAARLLKQTLIDHAQLSGTPATASPKEIASALVCLVDNTKIESEGKRAYVCRAKI